MRSRSVGARLCSARQADRRRPGTRFAVRPRALDAQRLWKAVCRLFMPAHPLRCPVLGGGALGSLGEPSYRLYSCARCAAQVRLCRRCDHGNVYCAGECARIRRRESVRRAGARYQRSRRGATRHAARQRAYRARVRCKVTHQGSLDRDPAGSLSRTRTAPRSCPDASAAEASDEDDRPRCAFCGTLLPPFTRIRAGPWGW